MIQNVLKSCISAPSKILPQRISRIFAGNTVPSQTPIAPKLARLGSDILSRADLGHFSISPDFRKAIRGVNFYATDISANPFSKKVKIKEHPELAESLNKLINEMPEFLRIFDSRVDRYKGELHKHVFSAFQELLLNPQYQRLSPRKKNIMEIATLLHDMGKIVTEGTPHVSKSTEIAERMLKGTDLPDKDKQLILKLIEHHHFSEEIKNGRMTHQDYAKIFNKDEFDLLKILVDSDIKSKIHIRPVQDLLDENIGFFRKQDMAFNFVPNKKPLLVSA